MPNLSKSTYLQGLQCPKLLWFRYNARDQFPPVDEGTQAVFDQGKEVGDLAKRLYPEGIEIDCDHTDYEQILALSKQHLARRVPLFEAGFSYNGGFARVDILNPVGDDEWDIIEVKSTASLKDAHLPDIAFQAYVLTGAGLKIRRCFLAHINTKYVRQGNLDPEQFFTRRDVTPQVSELSREVETKVEEMQRTIGLRVHPEVEIGRHCDNPYTCPLHERCWSFLPEDSVFTLYRGGAKGFKLLKEGIQRLADIPEETSLTANQKTQRATLLSGEPHVDRAAISTFLRKLEYPLSFLDFETYGSAIPFFDGTTPFQQIPFQFSLHVVRVPGAKPEHHEFLASGTHDPRPAFMQELQNVLPESGTVLSYNAGFELARLKECCAALPKFQPWLAKVQPRVVDLLTPFRGFRYYHPRQQGSASMKAVLPALTGKGYDHLAIQEGGTANREFLRITFGDVSAGERNKVRKQLLEYCALDTQGMVDIVQRLEALCS